MLKGTFFYCYLSDCLRKWGNMILAFFWFSGFVFGVLINSDTGHILSSLMLGALLSPLSIYGLLISVFLPLLFSAFVVYISQPILLPFVCFAKAFCVSFVSCGLFSIYGSGAWIFRLAVLFHSMFGSFLLLIFSMRHISGSMPLRKRELLYYGAPGFFAAAAEYYLMNPLLLELI